MARSQFVRRANFAYPWSERHEFHSPLTVRIVVGVCGLIVLILILLPFGLQYLRKQALDDRSLLNLSLANMRTVATDAEPALRQKALVDSIKKTLEERLLLYEQVEQTEYRMDALIVHLAEQIPDGVVLRSLDIRPPLRSATGRALRGTVDTGIPPELQNAMALLISGSARNSTVLDRFREALVASPLFDAVSQTEQVLEEGLTFTITARLPGSDRRLGEEGGP